MISWGFESPLFMARAVINNASPILLRKAVDDLMQAAWEKETPCIQVEEMIDRLVQVVATGRYVASEIPLGNVEEAIQNLSEEAEGLVKQFEEQLDNLPDFTPEENEKWLRDMGIPPETDDEEDKDD